MENIGIQGVDTGVGTAGVGFVVIPIQAEREEYIKNCYRTNTLTINGGLGYGFFSNVHTDIEVMQNISFPTDEENRGTAVIWVREAISQLPVIVGSLRKQEEYYSLGENQFRLQRSNSDKTNSVEIFVDGDESCIDINVIGDSNNPSDVKIKLSSENKDSTFTLSCDNELNIFSENTVNIESNKKAAIQVSSEGESKGSITYEIGEGLKYKDEFNNEVNCKDGEINIISNKINHNSGGEPMVLGDTLADLLNDLVTAIQKLTVMSPVGATSPPVNIADFISIQTKLNTIKSKKSNLE